jgi:hypothetical protein
MDAFGRVNPESFEAYEEDSGGLPDAARIQYAAVSFTPL